MLTTKPLIPASSAGVRSGISTSDSIDLSSVASRQTSLHGVTWQLESDRFPCLV